MISFNRVDGSRWNIPISSFAKYRLILAASLLLMVIMIGCIEKSAEVDIKGYWEIVKASRDNKSTSTLENAFINIDSDSTLITNLLRKEIQSSYVRDNDVIRQSSPELIEYQILNLTNDTLELHTEIRGYDFNFVLLKIDSLTAE